MKKIGNYNVNDTISYAEFRAVIDLVVEKSFDDKGNYDPTLKNFWLRYCVISYYSDYPLGEKAEGGFDELFKEIYGADCTAIFSYLNSNNEQLTDITLAILGKVEDILNYRYKASTYSKTDEALSKLIDAITEKVDEIDDIMTVDNVNKLVALSENLSSGSLSQEDIVNTIRTLNKEDKKIAVSGSKDGE